MRKNTSIKMPHNFSVKKVRATQLKLSKKIIKRDVLSKEIRYIAGVDVAYTGKLSIGAVAVLDFESLMLKESKTAICQTRFPYIPTLLSFREIPPTIFAIQKLKLEPDVFLVDGQGVMHPYGLGFASHLGLIIGKPTIGAAKSPLFGKIQTFTEHGWAPITDRDELIGAAVSTRKGRKPVYVSVGNMVSLEKAIAIVKHCTKTSAIPEPTRQAHLIAAEEKRKIQNNLLHNASYVESCV
jgi:deoxyribonuclease V